MSDDRLNYGIPEIGSKDNQGNWFENTGDEPDILVLNDLARLEEGRDLQLEAAVKTLPDQLGE